MSRQRRPTSRAAVALADAGLTLGDVASHLEITSQALSLQLSGTTKRVHPGLRDVLTYLADAETAGEVLDAAEDARLKNAVGLETAASRAVRDVIADVEGA